MLKKSTKYSKKQIENMREEIYYNIFGALADDGIDDEEASDIARDGVNKMTNKQIIKEYKKMTE